MPETQPDLLASFLIAPREGVAVSEIDIGQIVASLMRRLDGGPLNMLPSAARDPLAFMRGSGFGGEPPPAYALADGVALVSVKGVLLQEAFDLCGFELAAGYDRIGENAARAFAADDVGAVVLDVHSPGGMAVGNIELARDLRAMADASGKPLITMAGGQAASAAYAISVASDEIWTIESGFLGCIGTICTGVNVSEAMSREGLRAIVAAAPPGKAAEHPMLPARDEGQTRMQREVEGLAALFAGHVAERRRMTSAQVMALDAESFMGAQAIQQGLADHVMGRRAAMDRARSKIQRKAYSMPGNGGNEQQYGQAGAALLRAVGLDPAANLSTADIEAACKATSERASVGRKVADLTGLTSVAEQEGLLQAWKQAATVDLPAARDRAKVRTAQLAVSTGRLTPAQAYGADGTPAEREFPAAPKLSAGFAAMSLEAMEEHVKLAGALPATMAPPKPRARARAASLDDAAAKREGFESAAEYQAALDKYGPPNGVEQEGQ